MVINLGFCQCCVACLILAVNCFSPIQDYVVYARSGNITCVVTDGNYIFKYMNDVWLNSDKESKMGIQHA